jgi:uncharacterized protein DUF2442
MVDRLVNKSQGMLLRIEKVDQIGVSGTHCLRLLFNDGTKKTVDLSPLLLGPVFEPLKNATYFRRVLLDPVAGTVVWPNGADLAPEALHSLPPRRRRAEKRRKSPQKALQRPTPGRLR